MVNLGSFFDLPQMFWVVLVQHETLAIGVAPGHYDLVVRSMPIKVTDEPIVYESVVTPYFRTRFQIQAQIATQYLGPARFLSI